MSGFKNTGIHRYNRNLFTDIDFASALVTDHPLAEEPRDGTIQQPDHDANMAIDDVAHDDAAPNPDNNIIAPDPISHNEPAPGTSKDYVSPKEVMPFPKADRTKQKKAGRRKKGNMRVYTNTPVRNEVAEAKSLSKKTVERKEKVKSRKSLFATGDSDIPKEVTSSDSDTSLDFQLAHESDDEISDDEVIEGDFVVIQVKIRGTDQAKHFIARVDVIDGKEYEGIFMRRLSGKVQAESITFVPV